MYELKYKDMFGTTYILRFRIGTYAADKSLAIHAFYEEEDGMWCPFAGVTVCLGSENRLNCAYIDENNVSGIGAALEKAGVAKPTGRTAQSGFCVYPEYEFNEDILKKMDARDYSVYLNLYKGCYG